MILSRLILDKLRREHCGRDRAIRREDLLRYARLFEVDTTDRELRNIYCKLPVATCEQGIFWPIRTEELAEYKQYLKRKAIPLFERYQMVARAHPHLVPDNSVQLELF